MIVQQGSPLLSVALDEHFGGTILLALLIFQIGITCHLIVSDVPCSNYLCPVRWSYGGLVE
jgi:hypothetical protein